MGICRACKWWSKPEGEEMRRHCLRLDEDVDNPEVMNFIDCSCDRPLLITRGDFGCVQFEAKAD